MKDPATTSNPSARAQRDLALRFVAGLVGLLGFTLTIGGIWLLTLGGSLYYVLAGLALLGSGVLLWRADPRGLWLYAAVLVATLAWSIWEVGFDAWALLPRLLMIIVLGALAAWAYAVATRSTRAAITTSGVTTTLALATLIAAGLLDNGMIVPAQARSGNAAPALPEARADRDAEREPRSSPAREDWSAYGRDLGATRYSPLRQVTPANVRRLERVWSYRTRDLPPEGYEHKWAPETTPLKIGHSLYLCSATNILIALDAATGRERWRYDPQVSPEHIPYSATCRGVAYYEAPELEYEAPCKRRIIEGTLNARLIAVDADTGIPCADFGHAGQVDLLAGMGRSTPGYVAVTSPPTIVRGIAVVGHQVLDGQKESAPSGVVRGYDAVTGRLAWAWDMGRPDRKGLPPPGEEYTRGTPNTWTIFSGDEALGLVYVPMGNSAVDYWSGNRRDFEDRYSTALVALDVETGEVRWVFQTVHLDVWDYDLGSQGSLVDFPTERGPVPAVILPTKTGDIYVLDRRTGEPLTEVVERPVPQTPTVPGQRLSPVQPFSVGMPSMPREPLRERDTWGISPIDQMICRIQFRQASYQGMYTPPTTRQYFIQWPGYNGGNDWGSAAVDTARGVLVVNYNLTPMRDRLITRAEAQREGMIPLGEPGGKTESGGGVPQAEAPFAALISPWRSVSQTLCNKPPYGGIMAVDLATRKVLWNRALGTARRNGPWGIPSLLPFRIGTPNNGGPIITAGGLIFIAAATDNLIRAIDLRSGEQLWQDVLPAGGQATPMTYEADGRQYVVIMAGGHHFMETPIGDHLIAYALPISTPPTP